MMAATDLVRDHLGLPSPRPRASNDNRTAARLVATSYAIAFGAMWLQVLLPLAAILWGSR